MGKETSKSNIHVNMLKNYVKNLSGYWEEIIMRDGELSLKTTILPSVAENIGAIEIEFVNREHEEKDYEVKNTFSSILAKYGIEKNTDDPIHFGERSFLIIKPLLYRNWTKKQSELDNSRLIHEILIGDLLD